MKKSHTFSGFLFVSMCFLFSCKKFLDKKPRDDVKTISQLEELQGILDNSTLVNNGKYPIASEILSDNFYLSTSDFQLMESQNQNPLQISLYKWEKNDNTDLLWNGLYSGILTTNLVTDELSTLKRQAGDEEFYNQVKGAALYLRSHFFYGVAQLFSPAYQKATADKDLGIVLRLSADFNESSIRYSVKDTYDQITSDLKLAANLLPLTPLTKTRPSKPAAFGLLARTYLSMQEYDSAGKYANYCLSLYDSLIDYNTLNPASNAPFSQYNKEVIFSIRSNPISTFMGSRSKIDSVLYSSYEETDLRKILFFKPAVLGSGYQFKGDYEGIGIANTAANFFLFAGIVTDEIYLIRAESYARNGQKDLAMNDLNKLRLHRYTSGQFIPLSASDVNDAVEKILQERRKQLLRRGERWTDIRRLINDPVFKISPKRNINGNEILMTSGQTPYILQIPKTVIDFTRISQNN